ncbi:MAG: ferrous iron transport protein A [Firmicutes bacterium HGW-Firmicutes-10]|jgi:Fe2+ transport system protein FeoA|nr:MAG: ferrous iron transport protein A [Firmicutes bacterium HGW-Firmicutes-19]PKM89502.1 MAG: ferrous iron transport protein A [Firmicutes bacterium HGW-Firmicutes-10]
MTLKDVNPGQVCVIEGIGKKSSLRKRIIDMGLTIGTIIEVRKLAPLGDPIEILIRGYHLSLRKAEAAEVFVRLV